MGDNFFKILQTLFSLFCHCRLLNKENIPARGPAVFVSNHLGSYAPVAVLTSFPIRLYPWVEFQTMDWKLCPGYLRQDFVEPELRLKPPFSHIISWPISKFCVLLMQIIKAIPVCNKSMKLVTTWRRSLELLEQNKSLVIFPENDSAPFNEVMNAFDQGFVGLAPLYYEKTRRILNFIPVAVNKTAKAIKIGLPVSYNPKNNFSSERQRISKTLQDCITEMHTSLR